MYSLSQLKRGLQCSNLLLREANRLYHRRLNTRQFNTAGIDIFEEDWDNLIILDACRYDMFEEQNTVSGRLESRISRGSSTVEFLRGNVHGADLRDTVYVTANPKLHENIDYIDASFHTVINVWLDAWDETNRTVLPETMTESAIEAAEKYPNKRILVHYIQPHYPFLTDGSNPFENSQAFERSNEPGSWHQMMVGNASGSRQDVWDAYRETLVRALPAVRELLETVRGRSIVTSDHGNMVGERSRPIPIREWGHPRGIYTPKLITVPWLVQEADVRRRITREQATEQAEVNTDIAEDRLQQLGYA